MKAMTQVRESAGGALLRALLDEVQQQRAVWRNLPEAEQQQVIQRLRVKVDEFIRKAVRTIASAGFQGVPVQLKSIDIREPTKVTVLVSDEANLHLLIDHRKSDCVLSFAPSIEDFEEGMELIRADADQPELPLEDPNIDEEDGLPISSKARFYRERFRSIYGKYPKDLTCEERRSAMVKAAHTAVMDELRGKTDVEGDIDPDDIAVDESEPTAPGEGPLDPEPPQQEIRRETPEEARARRAALYPNMTREEAVKILATAEEVSDETERALDILHPRPEPFVSDPERVASNDAELAARAQPESAPDAIN